MSTITRTFQTWVEERDLDHETKILVVPLEDLEILPNLNWEPGDKVEVTITLKNHQVT